MLEGHSLRAGCTLQSFRKKPERISAAIPNAKGILLNNVLIVNSM
jgi:hypothetical protein